MLISERRFKDIESYLQVKFQKEDYGATGSVSDDLASFSQSIIQEAKAEISFSKKRRYSRSLEDIVSQPDESFSQMLFRLIRERNLDEVVTYKRAQVDRKLFSKIRSNDDYRPRKGTAVSLALALELSLDDTLDLLGKAGYTLSHSSKSDLIIEYFIEEQIFDIFEINEAMDAFGQVPL